MNIDTKTCYMKCTKCGKCQIIKYRFGKNRKIMPINVSLIEEQSIPKMCEKHEFICDKCKT